MKSFHSHDRPAPITPLRSAAPSAVRTIFKPRFAARPAWEGGRPERSRFLVFGRPAIGREEIREVVDTLRSGWIGMGPKTERFERLFARYTKATHAIATNSCTAALSLALDILRIGPGDEIITTPLTFAATANVIVHHGAKPVFVDVVSDTMNLDPSRIEPAITHQTRAIIPVHLAGQPCDMDTVHRVARRNRLRVIEDAAHAIEAWYKGGKIGSLSDFTAFSFYATKNLTTAEGGMLTTENDKWAAEARLRRLHGLTRDAWKRYSRFGFQPYEVLFPGHKYNMTDVQASMGIHQLARIEANLKKRERIWAYYKRSFAACPWFDLPAERPDRRHARHLFVLLLNLNRLRIDRDHFMAALKSENIGAGIHFVALHKHKFYRRLLQERPPALPVASDISARTVSIPLDAGMTLEDARSVVRAVLKVCTYYST